MKPIEKSLKKLFGQLA